MSSITEFDPAQQRVLDHDAGPLRVLGGPGTGKTTVLEERFLRLAGTAPDRILMLVANRAQKIALQDRLTTRLFDEAGLDALIEVPVYTWHGLAYHLVSRHYDRLGYDEPPVLLTSPEQWGAVRDALAGEPAANWPTYRHLLGNRGFVDEVVDFCIRAKQRVLEERELAELAAARPEWVEIVRFYRAHNSRLHSRATIDYPTLLADAVWLVDNHDDVRTALHRRFRHVLVDDAQELSVVQQGLLQFVAGPDKPDGSLVVAADPDSAIETFRGAEPEWLDSFADRFCSNERVELQTSYRLGPQLGAPARAFIDATGVRSHRPAEHRGESELEVKVFPNLSAEAEAVVRELRLAHLRDGIPYEDMAILLTSVRSMLPALERALESLEVPFSISAPDRPLEREPAVRAFCQLARHALGDGTDPDGFLELLRSPLVGLSDAEVRDLERAARVAGSTLPEMVDSRAGKLAAVASLRDLLSSNAERPADEAFWAVWTAVPYYRSLEEAARADLSHPANRDLDALVAFSRALARFVERRHGGGTLAEYLQAIGRADFGSDPWLPPERASRGVEVLSFHSAKGREWSIVAVSGCIEGAIPKGGRARGLFDPYFLSGEGVADRARRNDAEDRRVFYVALTRARTRCIVTASPGPSRRGRPSRFIEDLVGEIPEPEMPGDAAPLTFSEATARHRRVLANPGEDPAHRLAALGVVGRICELDPGCRAARPSEWWWRWDWTPGAIPLRAQVHSDGEDDLPADKLRTSYSRIGHYDNCGLAYLFSVVLGLDPERSHNMAFGTWIHKIFEDVENKLIQNLEGAKKAFAELFDASVFPNAVIARQFRRDGETMIERFARHIKVRDALLVEHQFTVDLDGHRIKGRIDRVDRRGNGLVVSDYKTSRNPISWEEARESLQLAIYYLAATSDPQISELGKPISMQLVYPGQLSKGDVTKRCQTPGEAEAALTRLRPLMEGVLAEDFRPHPEADCKWCKFKPLCPLWPEGKELPA